MSRASTPLLACLLVALLAGCGSSSRHAQASAAAPSPLGSLQVCLRKQGYQVSAEPPSVRRTAPRSFEFVAVWNLLNPDRVALALTVSKTRAGASRAAVWTRKANEKIGKGVVHAPVVQFGRIDVLWTTDPGPRDTNDIYRCVRQGR
jgi:hypothetical protein